MRKNVKQQLALRVLSTAALMAMVSSIATAAFAAEYDVTKGSVDILAEGGEQYITQWEDESKGTYVTDDKGEIKKRKDDDIVLTTKGEPTSNTVTITAEEKGDTANVTLEDVFINREGAWNSDSEAALTVKGDGNTSIELNGNNTLSSTGAHAGLEKTDAECSGTLTITDDKNDDGSEKEEKDKYGYSTGDDTGTLAVIGGGSGGAGIGGGDNGGVTSITISGGNVYAAATGAAAGIGGGNDGCGVQLRHGKRQKHRRRREQPGRGKAGLPHGNAGRYDHRRHRGGNGAGHQPGEHPGGVRRLDRQQRRREQL